MKSLILLFVLLFPVVSYGNIITIMSGKRDAPLAFPGAEGFGSGTRGAYEISSTPTIIHVTNLNSSGSGSFTEAVETSGPRIVVFDLGGIITLEDAWHPLITNDYLTIAGQTAPGDGICFRGNGIRIYANHVIVRGIRVRPTYIASLSDQAFQYRAGFLIGNDTGDTGDPSHANVIIDHCSISWTGDESLTIEAGAEYVTVSNNLITKPSNYGGHEYGPFIGPMSEYVSYHHNILAHADYRTPIVGGTNTQNDSVTIAPTNVEVINNIVYNPRKWGATAITRNSSYTGGAQPQDIVLMQDYHKAGNDTGIPTTSMCITAPSQSQAPASYVEDASQLYFYHNLTPSRQSQVDDEWDICCPDSCNAATEYNNWPFTASGVTVTEASANYTVFIVTDDGMDGTVPRAGAYPRDDVDEEVIDEVASGTSFLGTQGSQGPGPSSATTTTDWKNNQSLFPAYASGTNPWAIDTDSDDLPDGWENSEYGGLQETAHGDYDGDGYTNIEEFINSFLE